MQDIDWAQVAQSPTFQELRRKRFRFTVLAVLLSAGNAFLILVLAAFAPRFMGHVVADGLSVGLLWAIAQYVLIGALTYAYIRRSNGRLETLRQEVVRDAAGTTRTDATDADASLTPAGEVR